MSALDPLRTLGHGIRCTAMQVQVVLSYAQLCVFDAELDQPYNDWDAAHMEQGFSWRPGSVSFAAESADGPVLVDVTSGASPPPISDAATAIRVPFKVPPSGRIEVGSVMSGVQVLIPSGHYALYFVAPERKGQPYLVAFVPSNDRQAEVVKESSVARKQQTYKMTARAA